MNVLYWIIALVVVVVVCMIYVWDKRWQHYRNLPLHERLWEDYICTKGEEPAHDIATKKLSDHICEMYETAIDIKHLNEINGTLSSYCRRLPYTKAKWHGPFFTEEKVTCFAEKEAFFEKQQEEADKKFEEEWAKKEAERLKAAQDATTWEEANIVVEEGYNNSPSTRLALQKMDFFALREVLTSKSIHELITAIKHAAEHSLAKQFVPYMYECISRDEVGCANTVDALIEAAKRAPKEALDKDTALYMAFEKLYQQLRNS